MGDRAHEQLVEYYGIYKETDALYGQLAERSGMSDSMLWVLYAIRMFGEQCTQRDICHVWAMNKQTVHSALKKLLDGGYITLEVSEKDRRSKRICLTEQGEAFARAKIDPIFAAEEAAFRALEDGERAALMESTRKFETLLMQQIKPLLEP